jgi:hypothetical protein
MRQPTHTHYDPAMPPRQVPGTLLGCNNKDQHSPEMSEMWADYAYNPKLMPSQDTGLPADVERDLIAAYSKGRREGVEMCITDVFPAQADDGNGGGPIAYRVRVTNRTLYAVGEGRIWNTMNYGLYASGWVSFADNPHPGHEHWPVSCPNCGY